jgi:PAP2 superfamily
MKHSYAGAIGLIALLLFAGCRDKTEIPSLEKFPGNQLSAWNRKLTDIIITDVFTPPVCSRIYAYCNIAAYEALIPSKLEYSSFAERLNGLKAVPRPASILDTSYFPISSVIAFTTVSQKLLYNADAMKEMEKEYLEQLDNLFLNQSLKENAVEFGRTMGAHIVSWAMSDGYLQRTANPEYFVTKDPASWQPTPPDYMDAVEPNWGTLRPFTMDSSSLFRPLMSFKFDTLTSSEFYKEALIVYNAVNNLTAKDTLIAKYWDCNPNVSFNAGHITYFQQQISPGGHWIHIAASVAEKEKLDMVKTAEVLSKVSISLADAFISCWEAKYIYKTIRPETYINRYIDKDWKPFIQTPAFPEFPSGHSTISASAATMLTSLFGDNYAFTDSAEVPFGRPARHFSSFAEAAQEASISRLYGGIHFLKSLNQSASGGKRVGEYVVQKLNSNSHR